MSSWSCPHQVNDFCRKVKGAYCRPGMRGCVVFGRVTFQDGKVPYPVWPPGADPRERAEAEAALPAGEGSDGRER
jgi:hypothetical protein